jgi:hypothetical protein
MMTLTPELAGIAEGSPMKVNGPASGPEAVLLAGTKGPVSLTSEYLIWEIVRGEFPKLLKRTVWLTPPGWAPATTPGNVTAMGLIWRRAAWLWPVPRKLTGVLML